MSSSQYIAPYAVGTPNPPGAGKSTLYPDANGDWTQIKGASGTAQKVIGGGANYSANPANPTGANAAVFVMMGLAGSITPAFSGRALITICGNLTNSTATAGDGTGVKLYYGTGAAPANAAALTGTQIGLNVFSVNQRASSDLQPFSLSALVSGLTLGTAYWLDIAVELTTGGALGQAKNLTFSAVEL